MRTPPLVCSAPEPDAYAVPAAFTSQVLEDARLYAHHRAETELGIEDVKLALKSRVTHNYTEPPPKEVRRQWICFSASRLPWLFQLLLELAEKRNAEALPMIPQEAMGVYLPNREHLLTRPNYRVDSTTAAVSDPTFACYC